MRPLVPGVPTVAEVALAPHLQVQLLGGFRVKIDGVSSPEAAWQQRRTAKRLLKLMASEPRHALHRDQILEFLWPEADLDSAVNSFGKALHAARRALEPELQARGKSLYLHLRDDVLTLDTQRVWIDADHFQRLAQEALSRDEFSAYEKALAAYPGELLPEDRYERWVTERSTALSDLLVQVLAAGADVAERSGFNDRAVEWLRRVLEQDETREDIHRRLMLVYLRMGSRHQALRQYHQCRDILQRELEAEPETETEKLYQDIRENRLERPQPTTGMGADSVAPPVVSLWRSLSTPLVGRDRVLRRLQEEMARAMDGNGGMILVSGEAGVGKTRVIAEFANTALQDGVVVLWGTASVQSSLMPYGPCVEALETYLARLPMQEREALAARYPELIRLLPSLSPGAPPSREVGAGDIDPSRLFPAMVCLLTDLSWMRPLLLVLSDLHAADSSTVQLLHYLARLAVQRHWLVVGSYREEDTPARSELRKMLRNPSTGRLCRTIELRCLARQDCDQLVAALLPGGLLDTTLLDYIYTLSLGNPLFIEEMIRMMQERGGLVLADGQWQWSAPSQSVPSQVRNLVEDTIGQLDESVQRVLTLAAIANDEFSLAELQAAGAALSPPITNEVFLDALDQALEARILKEQEHGYVFRHPLFRAALHEQLARHRLVQFQAALGHPRQDRPEPLNGNNHHARAVPSLEEVTQRAEQLSPSQAATMYGELVDRLDQLDLSREGARAREKLTNALVGAARYDRALHVLAEAEQLYRKTEDQEGLARVTALAGIVQCERDEVIGA